MGSKARKFRVKIRNVEQARLDDEKQIKWNTEYKLEQEKREKERTKVQEVVPVTYSSKPTIRKGSSLILIASITAMLSCSSNNK